MNTNAYTALSRQNRASCSRYSAARVNALAQPVSNPEIDTRRNLLLARLPEAQLARLLPHVERVDMQVGEVLSDSSSQSEDVYFPITAIVSLLYEMQDGWSAEMASVGNEGMIGVGSFMAGETMPGLAEVRCAGQGFRLRSRILKEQYDSSEPLRHALLSYIQALVVEIALTAACSRRHTTTQQLCRYLLLNLDRSLGCDMVLTQETIAASLGVRRESVTQAAGQLRAENLIDYWRGHITVLNRDGLESQSCECYLVGKKTMDRLLPNRNGLRSASSGARVAVQHSAQFVRPNRMVAACAR